MSPFLSGGRFQNLRRFNDFMNCSIIVQIVDICKIEGSLENKIDSFYINEGIKLQCERGQKKM
jgi:hypothetical protein